MQAESSRGIKKLNLERFNTMQETDPRKVPIFGTPGLRFYPTEAELVGKYLHKKMVGGLTPDDGFFVRDCDLYGKEEPWEIWERFGGRELTQIEDLFFFTPLKKKSVRGCRVDRTVGPSGGTWLCKNSSEEIEAFGQDGRRLVAYKKRFTYTNPRSDHNGCWIIHEYCCLCPDHPHNKDANVVLCRLRKNQPAPGIKVAKLKKRPADNEGNQDEKSAKSRKNPSKRRKLKNRKEETEPIIDDSQFPIPDSEHIEAHMYIEPSRLMVDKDKPCFPENMPMGSTWMNGTATEVLEEAAPEADVFFVGETGVQQEVGVGAEMEGALGLEDLNLDDFSVNPPCNLLSVLMRSDNLQTAADGSDFARTSFLEQQCPVVHEQDPISPLDVTLLPKLFSESQQDPGDNYCLEDSFVQDLLQEIPPDFSSQGD